MNNPYDLPLLTAAEYTDTVPKYVSVMTPQGLKRIPLTELLTKSRGADRDLLLPAKYRNISNYRVTNVLNFDFAVGANNRDFHLTFMPEVESYDYVQLVLFSGQTANKATGITAFVASSANLTSTIHPTGTPVPVTWSGAGSVNLPDGTSTALAAVASDWMALKSIARNDTPTYNLPILMVRLHLPAGGGALLYTADGSSDFTFNSDTYWPGRRYLRFTQTGAGLDSVTTEANFTSTSEGNTLPAMVIRLASKHGKILTLAVTGDSISSGSRTTGGVMCGTLRAALAETSFNFPVSYCGNGWAGVTTTTYLAQAKLFNAYVHPQVHMYQVYSSNDGALTQSIADNQMQRFADFLRDCNANDVLGCGIGPHPLQTDTLTISNLKSAMQTELNALATTRGVPIVDRYNNLTDFTQFNGSGGYGYKAGFYYTGDNIHLIDAGALADAQIIRTLVQQIRNANQ